MKRVFIADDDFLARTYFKQMIDWRAYGFEICGEAKNGQEALERMAVLKPDILLTDISMPVMDGIELIRRVQAKEWNMRILVFSCHDDFEYVKEAMRLGIDDYLLKNDLIPEVLLKAIMPFADSSESVEAKQEAEDVIETGSNRPGWNSIECDLDTEWEEFSSGLQVDNHGLMAILINIPHWCERREVLGDVESLTLQQSFQDMCEQSVVSGEFSGDVTLMGIMHSGISENIWGIFLDFGAYAIPEKMRSCSTSIAAKLEQLSKRYFNFEVGVYLSTDLMGTDELRKSWFGLVEQLKALEESKPEGVKRRLEVTHPAILHALQYIDEHYREDLSLTMVAESVSLNPAYFSTLFKKEVSSGFAAYLSGLRLEAVRKRLIAGNEKIKEIAFTEGFYDYQYFCRLFHRTFGVSPSDYRKNS